MHSEQQRPRTLTRAPSSLVARHFFELFQFRHMNFPSGMILGWRFAFFRLGASVSFAAWTVARFRADWDLHSLLGLLMSVCLVSCRGKAASVRKKWSKLKDEMDLPTLSRHAKARDRAGNTKVSSRKAASNSSRVHLFWSS